MEALGVEIFFGTLERPNTGLLEDVLRDPVARPYNKGVGGQGCARAYPRTSPGVAHLGVRAGVRHRNQRRASRASTAAWTVPQTRWTAVEEVLVHCRKNILFPKETTV